MNPMGPLMPITKPAIVREIRETLRNPSLTTKNEWRQHWNFLFSMNGPSNSSDAAAMLWQVHQAFFDFIIENASLPAFLLRLAALVCDEPE